MTNNDKLSKFISLILRHKPEVINITLDNNGYANTNDLLNGINNTGRHITMDILTNIVNTDNKNRYSFNKDKTKIRANQGHSINVDVELKKTTPPPYLYHGTSTSNIDNINKYGIKKMSRLYVHLSNNIETAINVGKRHGKPIVLKVDTNKVLKNGYNFYLSENNVWLTEFVPNNCFEILYIDN